MSTGSSSTIILHERKTESLPIRSAIAALSPSRVIRDSIRCAAGPRRLLAVYALVFVFASPSAATSGAPLELAVLGDYGFASVAEQRVAAMVASWDPSAVLTAGDNNYPSGGAATIDSRVGQYYQQFIGNYQGVYGPGAGNEPGANRFFPALGNHDWRTPGAAPYLDYFDLPGRGFENSSGNERYYDFRLGDAQFFAYDSDPNEPDGVMQGSVQAEWLRTQLAASDATWKIVYFHHAPFSSGQHGSDARLQLPFKEWGADVVLSAHDHTYERVIYDGLPYFVVGTAGANLYNFKEPICGSRARFNESHGALRITLDGEQAMFEFLSIDDGADGLNGGRLIDRYVLDKTQPALEPLPGDTDQNGVVDLADLNTIRNGFGRVVGGDADNDCRTTLADLNWVRNNFSGVGPGDTNGDGTVDLADLNAARNGFGGVTGGDLNRNGVIDLEDLNLLRNNFGRTAGESAVPEPAAIHLAFAILLCLAGHGGSRTMFSTLPAR